MEEIRKEIKMDYETWKKIKIFSAYRGISLKNAIKEITDQYFENQKNKNFMTDESKQ